MKTILVVTSVGNTKQCVDNWSQNVKHLQQYEDNFSFMFIHYDVNDIWKSTFENYDSYIIRLHGGSKIRNWQMVTEDIVNKYDYLWLVDEDVAMNTFDWNIFKKYATHEVVLSPARLKHEAHTHLIDGQVTIHGCVGKKTLMSHTRKEMSKSWLLSFTHVFGQLYTKNYF